MQLQGQRCRLYVSLATDLKFRLLGFRLERFDRMGVERVCSGIGVPNTYEYFRDIEKIPESPDVAQRTKPRKDQAKANVDAALDPNNPSELCRVTVDMLVSILEEKRETLCSKFLLPVVFISLAA